MKFFRQWIEKKFFCRLKLRHQMRHGKSLRLPISLVLFFSANWRGQVNLCRSCLWRWGENVCRLDSNVIILVVRTCRTIQLNIFLIQSMRIGHCIKIRGDFSSLTEVLIEREMYFFLDLKLSDNKTKSIEICWEFHDRFFIDVFSRTIEISFWSLLTMQTY